MLKPEIDVGKHGLPDTAGSVGCWSRDSSSGEVGQGIFLNVFSPLFSRACERVCERNPLVVFLKAIQRILWLAYGNDTTGSENRSKAEVVLEALSNSDSIRRQELMRQIGLDESVESDVDDFNDLVRPLRGNASTNSSYSEPPGLSFLESGEEYRLSRTAFDASFKMLRKDVVDFLTRFQGEEVPDTKTLDQILWLVYANNGNTYRYRENACQVLKNLLEAGEASKQELMDEIGFEYRDENDDQRFRGMMKYLRASWRDEEDALNPLHTSNHGFLVRQQMKGQTAYYRVDVREFKSAMNVVAGNIRSFVG